MLPLPKHLLIGFPLIDGQHQSLLGQLSNLFNDPEDHPRSAEFSETLSRLSSEIIEHFADEERLMRSLGLPPAMLARHVDAHNQIIEQITQLSFDLMKDGQIGRNAVIAQVKEWVLGHLNEYDLPLRDY